MPKRKAASEQHEAKKPEIDSDGQKPEADSSPKKPEIDSGGVRLPGPLVKLHSGGVGLLLGTRIPKDYFLTKGFGETDQGGGVDPWETGSYDLALEMAQIHNFNIVPYTSCLPPEASEITMTNAMPSFHHGAVLECIMAVMHGMQGDRISAGVGAAMVRRKEDKEVVGGFAAEYKGHAQHKHVEQILQSDLSAIFQRRYDTAKFELMGTKYTIMVHEVTKGYGTVLASICFSTYIMPILN
ncbi:hypothetical protein WJX72_007928 [[Myrmecia] bisecta]|uniref:arginine decarboxylase n=1 Tax=[Myrmecia] bisecta TaxID=41462 RepID=A0AAW1R7M5_9CHLO